MPQGTLRFVLIAVFIDTMSFGIVIPVFPRLIASLAHVDIAEAARYGGALAFTYAIVQFCCAPIGGALGDRFGRRPVLLASLATFALDYLAMAFAPTLAWLFVTRAIAGASGATYSTAFAAVADVSAPEERAKRFGLVGASFGIGFVAGPLLGGLLGALGTRAPFYGAAAVALANLVFGCVALRETLPEASRRPFAWSRANPFGALLGLRETPSVRVWLGALFCWQMAFFVMPSVWAYYGVLKFGWNPAIVGATLAISGLLMALVQGRLIGVVVPRFGERNAALFGVAGATLSFVMFAFASTTWLMFVALVPWACAGFVSPALNALMSGAMPASQQGELQGIVASSMGLASILSPPVMTLLFSHFSTGGTEPYFPGAAFVAAAFFAIVTGAIVAFVQTRGAQPA